MATIGILQERIIRESNVVAEQLQHALDSRILIEQVKGVLSQTGPVDMGDAFTALRAYARNNNLTLRAVAEGVIDRSLNILTTPKLATPASAMWHHPGTGGRPRGKSRPHAEGAT